MYYKDTNGTSHPITNVYFKNIYGQVSPVWPNEYWVSDVEILEYTSNNSFTRTIDYSVSNGEPVYTVGNNTLPGLLPDHNYVITGTIQYGDGTVMSPVSGCYFQHFTTVNPTPSGCWTAGQTDYTTNQITGTSDPYGVYHASDAVTNALSMQSVLGYHIPAASDEVVRLGFGDSYNFQNVTPIILKRISLSESCAIFDSNNNQISASSVSIGANDSITLTPKTRVTGTGYTGNWETHTNWTVNNTTNWCIITNNQDGSYTFTSNSSTPNTVNIQFTSPNGTILSLYFTYTGMIYRAFIGSDLNSSSMTLSETKSVTVEQTSAVDPQESDWSSYSGEFTITTSDSSVVSVNNTNHTITPVSDGTSTIEVTVGTTVLRSVVVTVSFSNRTIYGKITKDAGSTYETIGNQSYFSLGNGTDFEYNISTTTGNPICFEFYNSSVNGGQDPINNIAYDDVSKPSNTEIGSWNSNGFNIVPTSTTSGNYDITVKVGSTSIGRIYGTFSATSN